ncbi:MAG: alpha-isopropylmalate synthase regulatory domain-containing protein [Promethearchaeota archaeon]
MVHFYPSIDEIYLSDFKVRIINKAGNASKVRMLVETNDNNNSWGIIGTHENIIVASWKALVDSYIFQLLKKETNW